MLCTFVIVIEKREAEEKAAELAKKKEELEEETRKQEEETRRQREEIETIKRRTAEDEAEKEKLVMSRTKLNNNNMDSKFYNLPFLHSCTSLSAALHTI